MRRRTTKNGSRFIVDGNIWTALASLKANPQVKNFRRFGKGKGAYVNVVAWASSQGAFEKKVKRHVADLDCILVKLEEIKLLESKMQQQDFPDELVTMRETARRQPDDTVWGTFHIWHQENAN